MWKSEIMGIIFNVQEYALHDGQGIRTIVFLKGCPLRCRWCCNPEGQERHQELMHSKALCKQCGGCTAACPKGAVSLDDDGYPAFDRGQCRLCTQELCEKKCPERAIKIVGREWSPQELYRRVETNSLFYRNSGGGITLSGGEPLVQTDFVRKFLTLCRNTGLPLGVETCGMFEWNEVKDFIEEFDFIYFDIKCLDAELHRCVTGSDNEMIIQNLERLEPSKTTVTIPVIPAISDNAEMMTAVAELCGKLKISRVRLLPYHTLGETKYRDLGRDYQMDKSLAIDRSDVERLRSILIHRGLNCWVE